MNFSNNKAAFLRLGGVVALLISLLSMSSIPSVKTDREGHVLTKLWSTYEQASSSDLPKNQLAILEKIKSEALQSRLSWDYYDACSRYVDIASRIDWKQYDSLMSRRQREIKEYGEPSLLYFEDLNYRGQLKSDFLEENRGKLRSASNPEFYKRDWNITGKAYSEILINGFRNDYEWILWSMFERRMIGAEELLSYYSGRYPEEQLLRYEQICAMSQEDAAAVSELKRRMEAFSAEYSNKAVSLLSRQYLLMHQFYEFEKDNASSDQYKALREACVKFENDRSAFAGARTANGVAKVVPALPEDRLLAKCCNEIEGLIETLDRKSLDFSITDGEIKVLFRNLSKAEIKLNKDKKTIYSTVLRLDSPSYYVIDTITMRLPVFDDGTYQVVCSEGKEKVEKDWDKYTVSLAVKYDAAGFAAYAADYKSGEPVNGYAGGFVRVKDKKQGDEFQIEFKDGSLVRKSRPVRLSTSNIGPFSQDDPLRSILITDRTAFRPEETVNWKAILFYHGNSLKSAGPGQKVKVCLKDAENREIEAKELITNEYGSLASSFVIPRRDRNGRFSLSVYVSGRCIETTYLTVDDFVLPTFKLDFDRTEPVQAGDTAAVRGKIKAYSGHNLAAAHITYSVSRWGEQLEEGELKLDRDGSFIINVPTQKDSYQNFRIMVRVVDATGETAEFQTMFYTFIKDETREEPKEYIFNDKSTQNAIAVEVIASDKKVWAVADLYGFDGKLLESRMVSFEPDGGNAANTIISYDWKENYPDAVNLNILYFQNGRKYSYSVTKRRPDTRYDLPVSFTRFLDTTRPGSEYTFSIKTLPGVECAATIFDKSTEVISGNLWNRVKAREYPLYSMRYDCVTGLDETMQRYLMMRSVNKMSTAGMANGAMAEEMVLMDAAPAPMPQAEMDMEVIETAEESANPDIREDFAPTIAWEPFLYSDEEGRIAFNFRNDDKLSTFYVQLYAHDKSMRNATLRKEMIVTLPVKIAVVEPQFLYANDSYNIRVTLSNGTGEEVSGSIDINGVKKSVKVPAYGAAVSEVAMKLPEEEAELEITAVFVPDNAADASDGIKVKLPVLKPVQTITEAHSAVLSPDGDGMINASRRSELEASLRKEFVGVDGKSAQLREISILDMVKEAVPQTFEIGAENSVSLGKTLYAAALAKTLGSQGLSAQQQDELVKKLLSCHNADGGFAWIKGMESSPLITAVLLDYFASMRKRGLALPEAVSALLPAAVAYTDNHYFNDDKRPYWRGHLTMAQYLHIRSMYPEVDLAEKTGAKWRKEAKAYLLPSRERGLNGQIYAKARRMLTLQALSSSSEALALAKKFGIRLWTASRINASIEKDTASLVQYAVAHRGGGIYFPDAVMPWRGLLESELYAHSLLCDLLESRSEFEIAEGIRLWLMLQKETQHWGNDPAIVNALASVLDGSQATLQTRVLALSATYTAPFEEIRPAGNGFSVSQSYFKISSDGKRVPLSEGDVLNIGDKVVSVCEIWNEENRSFVKLTLPRPACLRPEQQLSGYGYWGSYRDVKSDRTEFWFESYPEEKSNVEELCFVTQSGIFHSAAAVIESEYAPHYRANSEASISLRASGAGQD